MIYLVDTDVLIEILRNNRIVAEELRALHRAGHLLCYSPVTRAEIPRRFAPCLAHNAKKPGHPKASRHIRRRG